MFLQIPEGREVKISQHIFPEHEKKENQTKQWLATDGEQNQLETSLWGLKGNTAKMPMSRVTLTLTCLECLYFLS